MHELGWLRLDGNLIHLTDVQVKVVERVAEGFKEDPVRKYIPIVDEYYKAIEDAMR
ncbi:MAG: hypothetical protein QXR26_08850 [Candidatus Caldarchaeum sp.]